jgi:hypothetical protein
MEIQPGGLEAAEVFNGKFSQHFSRIIGLSALG